MYLQVFKRIIDIVASLLILLITSLLLLTAAVFIKLNSPGPVFYYQSRVGKDGRVFQLIKLRTMTVDPSRDLKQTTNADPDVFQVGKILRRTKLDELPQIVNVLRGDMSLVGPRPCLSQTQKVMPGWAKKRFEVRPGLTGLAQINGNIALTWEERWRYDVRYVGEASFFIDFKIMLKTVIVVLVGEERFKKPL